MSAPVTCPRCATPATAGDRFCGGCGADRATTPAALTAAVDAAFDPGDAPTAPIRLPRHARQPMEPPSQRSHHAVGRPAAPERAAAPTPPFHGIEPVAPNQQARPAATPALPLPVWTVAALAASAALVQMITALVGFPTSSMAGADWSTQAVATLPAFGIVAGTAAVAGAALRRSATTVIFAGTLALAAVVAGVGSSPDTSPGPVTGMLVAAAAALVLVDDRFAVTGRGVELPLAWWWTGGCGAAALYELVVSHEVDGGTTGQVVAGCVFLVLAVAGAICASELPSGRAAPRWTLVVALPVALVAITAGDTGGHVVWPLVVVHAVLAALVVRPLLPASTAAVGALAERRARVLALSPAVRLGSVGALVVLTGIVLAAARWTSSSTSGYSGYSDDYSTSTGSFSGATAAIVVVGVLALAAALTPTMTPLWRSGLVVSGGFSLWLAWHSSNALDDGESTFFWTVAFPLVIVGSAVWGAWTNRTTGATSARPGWMGEGALPPMLDLAFIAPTTAGARSRTCLELSTTVSPEAALDAVVRATGVRGNWFRTYGDVVAVTARADHGVGLKIGGSCTFRAFVTGGGRTELRVGGMDRWTTSRWYLDFLVPISPAKVEGFRMYKLYLRTVASEIARLDPSTRARIGKAST